MRRVFDVLAQQRQVEQVGHAQAAAGYLVFIRWPDAARGGADLYAPGCGFRGQFDHAVVRQDHLRAVADEQLAVHFHARAAQRVHFLEEGEWINDDAVADHGRAVLAQDAARHQLQDELLARDGDRVPGVVAARIARHHREAVRQNVDDLALAFVAPLGADHDCCLW